jgi:hypothetical protein
VNLYRAIMSVNQSRAHHYVPRWYQKRFLPPGQHKLFYLDLYPETIVQDGVPHQRRALRQLGPASCFFQPDMYTLRFGSQTTDRMEREFFGAIDDRGHKAVAYFAGFSEVAEGTRTAFNTLPPYMGAQRFRTPRGLDELKYLAAARPGDQNAALNALRAVFQSYATMWAEGVWEVVRARRSPTKLIVSDDPVTFYCKHVFPSEWKYPNDVSLLQIGTRTIFPLGMEACLIITHLQLTRNPWATPTEHRANARFYGRTLIDMRRVQFGRELEEDEVLRINYILKRRAARYVAAAEEAWLYPEQQATTTEWTKLDDDWFLLPHLWKIPFTSEIMMGFNDGTVWASDEYGRHPGNPAFREKRLHEEEWFTHQLAEREWAKKRAGKSAAHIDAREVTDSVGDGMVEKYLRSEGLLPEVPKEQK